MEQFDKKLSNMTPKGMEISDFMDIARAKDPEMDLYGYPMGDWEQRREFSKRVSQGLSNVCFDEGDVKLTPTR